MYLGHKLEIAGRAVYYARHLVGYCGHTSHVILLYCVSVKSMAVTESDKQLRLLIASSDGYIKLYDVCVEVCNLQKTL